MHCPCLCRPLLPLPVYPASVCVCLCLCMPLPVYASACLCYLCMVLRRYASMTTNVPGWLTRQSAWQSQIGGAAGYTCES
eukprot:COSAG03_NODE_2358_length_2849_cov_4798.631732_2_plen_80_part_00